MPRAASAPTAASLEATWRGRNAQIRPTAAGSQMRMERGIRSALQEEVEADAGDAEDEKRREGAQRAGLGGAHGGRAGAHDQRAAADQRAVDDHALEGVL